MKLYLRLRELLELRSSFSPEMGNDLKLLKSKGRAHGLHGDVHDGGGGVCVMSAGVKRENTQKNGPASS